MKVYLDNCSLQRPLDDQSQARIRIETQAIEEILIRCRSGSLQLISSAVLEKEVNETPNSRRRLLTSQMLSLASETVPLTVEVVERGREFERRGIRQFDALHLAFAESAEAEYFCTCDDIFLRKAKASNDLKLIAVSPLELLQELFL